MQPADQTGSAALPGWYPDPSGAPAQRYWDGTSWSGPAVAATRNPAAPRPKRSWIPWLIAGTAVLVAMVLLLMLWGMRPGRQGQPGQPGEHYQRHATAW